MRTTVTIPDERLADLLEATGTRNRTAAINHAIDTYLRDAKLERLRALRGDVEIASNDEIEGWDRDEFRAG